MKSNPNVLGLLWLPENFYLHIKPAGQTLIDNRNLFVSKQAYHSFSGYAYSQLKRMTHLSYAGYMGVKRKALVDKFGYDTKNAAHCIRLFRMGIEFLTDGELHVVREDASQLIQIKQGQWPLSKVQREADKLFKKMEEAYINSKLPDKVNFDMVNELVINTLKQGL